MIGLIASKNQWDRQMRVMLPVFLGVAGTALLFAYFEVHSMRARRSIVKFLDAPDGEFEVTVNGNFWGADKDMLDAIRHIHFEPGHHSHPEHEIFVEVQSSRGKLELVFGRDSGNTNEYWVFWTKEAGKQSRLEIGRVDTTVLGRE
jgi:hypothetical protein